VSVGYCYWPCLAEAILETIADRPGLKLCELRRFFPRIVGPKSNLYFAPEVTQRRHYVVNPTGIDFLYGIVLT
jgi:hypothetical protein